MGKHRNPTKPRKACPSCTYSRLAHSAYTCACQLQKYNMETHAMHLGLGTEHGKQIWKAQMDFLWKLHDQGRFHDLSWEPGYAAFDELMGAETVQPCPVWFPNGDGRAYPDDRIPRGWAWLIGVSDRSLNPGAHVLGGVKLGGMEGRRALGGVNGRLGAPVEAQVGSVREDTGDKNGSSSRRDAGQRSSSSRVISKNSSAVREGQKLT